MLIVGANQNRTGRESDMFGEDVAHFDVARHLLSRGHDRLSHGARELASDPHLRVISFPSSTRYFRHPFAPTPRGCA
jgi:hypothetical protein